MNDEINRKYTETNPYSFGGKYRVYKHYPKFSVDEALKESDTYSKFKHLSMYIVNESYSSQMLFFLLNQS